MNERIQELAEQANIEFTYDPTETPMRAFAECWEDDLKKFAESIVAKVLDEVATRAYVSGDRAWSDDVDRPWIELEFGFGKLHDAKTSRVKQ